MFLMSFLNFTISLFFTVEKSSVIERKKLLLLKVAEIIHLYKTSKI